MSEVVAQLDKSLSSRRAWIEIIINDLSHTTNLASLSSRRAWIEIKVATIKLDKGKGRSPHGERGLK